MKSSKLRTVYIDMDGTIAKWNVGKTMEEISEAGYFYSLDPMEMMVEVVKSLLRNVEKLDVKLVFLSSVINEQAAKDKLSWLKRHFEGYNNWEAIFVPYGISKYEYAKATKDDVLIDDNTDMLLKWGGVGIKVYNGINNTKHRWKGYILNADSEKEIIYNTLTGIIKNLPCIV